jgi:enoyl-CoA hydratase/carnithine racemase
MADDVLVESRGPIRTVTFNRPEQRNALPPEGWARLRDRLA